MNTYTFTDFPFAESHYQPSQISTDFPKQIQPSIQEKKFLEAHKKQDLLFKAHSFLKEHDTAQDNWLHRVILSIQKFKELKRDSNRNDIFAQLSLYIHFYVNQTGESLRTFFISKKAKNGSSGLPATLYVNKNTTEAYVIPQKKHASLNTIDNLTVRSGFKLNYITNDFRPITVINTKTYLQKSEQSVGAMKKLHGKECHLQVFHSFNRISVKTEQNINPLTDIDIKIKFKEYLLTEYVSYSLTHFIARKPNTKELISICKYAIQSVDEAHAIGLYHGAISEKEIWVKTVPSNKENPEEHIFKAIVTGWSLSDEQDHLGTTSYLYDYVEHTAPEVLSYGLATDEQRKAADIYALGMCLLKILLKDDAEHIPFLRKDKKEMNSFEQIHLDHVNDAMKKFYCCSSVKQILLWYKENRVNLSSIESFFANATTLVYYDVEYAIVQKYIFSIKSEKEIEFINALEIITEMINPNPLFRPSCSEIIEKLNQLTAFLSV